MSALLFMILITAMLSAITQLSCITNWRIRAGLAIGIAAIAYWLHPLALESNIGLFNLIQSSSDITVALAIILFLESFLNGHASFALLNKYYGKKMSISGYERFWYFYNMLPGPGLLISLFLIQVWFYLNVSAIDYKMFAQVFALGILLLLVFLPMLLQLFLKALEQRIELRLPILLVQAIFAIGLTVQTLSQKVQISAVLFDWQAVLISTIVFMLLTLLGYATYHKCLHPDRSIFKYILLSFNKTENNEPV